MALVSVDSSNFSAFSIVSVDSGNSSAVSMQLTQNQISLSLKILITAVSVVAVSAFGFLLAGLTGGLVCAVVIGAAVWLALSRQTAQVEELAVDPNMIATIQALFPMIRAGQSHPKIERLSQPGGMQTFCHADFPGMMFKILPAMTPSNEVQKLFENTRKAKQACEEHGLDLLVIPQVQLFSVTDPEYGYEHSVIVEQRLDLAPDSAQKEFYQAYAADLTESLRQLTTLIIETGFRDPILSNIPVLDHAPDFHGNRRIAFTSLKLMDSAENGIRTLVHSLYLEEQMDLVLQIAVERGVLVQTEADKLKEVRLLRIEYQREYLEFSTSLGLLDNPLKPIPLSVVDDLQFGEEPAEHVETMKEVAKDVIKEINRLIAWNPRSRREIELDLEDVGSPLFKYRMHGAQGSSSGALNIEGLWIRKIIDALIAQGQVFCLLKQTNNDYYKIQA